MRPPIYFYSPSVIWPARVFLGCPVGPWAGDSATRRALSTAAAGRRGRLRSVLWQDPSLPAGVSSPVRARQVAGVGGRGPSSLVEEIGWAAGIKAINLAVITPTGGAATGGTRSRVCTHAFAFWRRRRVC